MAYENIIYEKIEGNLVKITLNRPEKRNALDHLTIEEIEEAFVEADLDEDVRVIILGANGKDFSAGYDISGKGQNPRGARLSKVQATRLTGMERMLKLDDYFILNQATAVRNVSKPTIAMVQGNAVAAGWMYASMCDIIIASDDAKFQEPLSRWASASFETLPHPYDVGFRKAKMLLYTGDPISAQDAYQAGLLSLVVPREKLEEETLGLARRIARNKPIALSLVKRSFRFAEDQMGYTAANQFHYMCHMFAHATDEKKAWDKESAEARQQGGVKAVLQARDGKFKAQ